MDVREALEEILRDHVGRYARSDSIHLAPIIERALDELITAMSDDHLCAMPPEVRARWHDVFAAAMMGGS